MIASVYRLTRVDFKSLGLKDAYGLHKAVYSLFPQADNGKTRDFLFADKGGDWQERKILILSERRPQVPEHGAIESKEIPDAFLRHDHYGFEVTLNPTKREKATGKTVAIRGKENLCKWFIAKAPNLGFEVLSESLQVQNTGVQTFEKDGAQCTHGMATFIGKLKVTNREEFIKSFKHGIGRAKAFGFGLLQIVPLQA
jgi:CRISPR system Cascade subunit CasE